LLIAAVIGLFVVTGLAAQQTQAADQAWLEGRYDAARAAYLRVLAQDPHNVRANLRLGVLLSWEGKLDSSLVLIGRARAGDPADPDIRLIQARVMAWAARYDEALLSYDSLLVQ
jgi:tetratricopeptide (TPR) repeat protein